MKVLNPLVEVIPTKKISMVSAQGQGKYFYNEFLMGRMTSEELTRKLDFIGRTYDIEFYCANNNIYVEDKLNVFYGRN